MSTDIYARPDLTKKVRYNRKVQEDEEEKEVDIDESAEYIRDDHIYFQSQEPGPQTQKNPCRAAALCLGVLCLLTTAAIITLCVTYILATLEKEQLQTRYDDLSNNHSQLQTKLLGTTGKCPDGWTRFGSSCYLKPTETKTWDGSRRACRERGADLVSITSKEEQELVTKLNMNGKSWIGLRAVWTGSGLWMWEWVDGSPLTETFWGTGQNQNPDYMYAASCCDRQGKWMRRSIYYTSSSYICEISIS